MATPEQLKLAKKLNIGAWIITIIVLILVGSMRRIHLDIDVDLGFLPGLHAILNTIAAILLIFAYLNIRKRKVETHKKLMYSAITVSTLFLISYVVYHTTTPETFFCKEGPVRYLYFFLLITHVVLAAFIFPFILFTFVRAYTGQFDRHRKMARWVFPVWLYVAITGPLVYLMLMPCYE